MSNDNPLAELPHEVTLTLDEVRVVLFALDLVETADIGEPKRATVRRAIRIITDSGSPGSAPQNGPGPSGGGARPRGDAGSLAGGAGAVARCLTLTVEATSRPTRSVDRG